ncbi:hypothetical protein B0H13DRAFT_2096826, partial [Mycena leptocephala]
SQIVLGLVISGVSSTAVLLILYGYAAWNPVSRRYLDRVSFRLLVYALLAHIVFGVVLVVGTLTPYPNWRCELLAFLTNLSLMFSAGMFFCIAINLPLVLAYDVNGQKMEKYYVFGTALVCLICNIAPYAAGKLGGAADGGCWYTSTDPREVLRWLIGTQTVWILLASLDTRGFRTDTQLGATYTSEASRRMGSNILMFRNIIFRIGLYPLVACLLNISTAVLDLHSEQNKLSKQGFLIDLAIYAGRPLIYVLLAATDPTTPTGCLSTVIIDMPPNDVECEPGWSRKEPTQEQSPMATGTSASSAEEWNTATDRGQGGIVMNRTPTQPGSVIDVVSHI